MERQKRIYRHLMTLEQARETFLSTFAGLEAGREMVVTREARGRVLVGPVRALRSVPASHSAAMDGLAVKAASTFGALAERPVTLTGEQAFEVDTGDPLPEGTDAVVMIERVERAEGGWEVREAVYPWQNVRKAGEDMVKGEIILPAHHRVGAYDEGALLAAGVLKLEVFQRPRVLIIPTGSEIVLPETEPLPEGALPEFNGQILASLIAECGAKATLLPPVPDTLTHLRGKVAAGLAEGYHLILIIAGSSAGSEDLTPTLLEEMGRLLVHGVTVMPGKPTLLAEVQGHPVVGIPGYPVSAVVSFRELVRPLLYRMQGLTPPEPPTMTVTMGRKVPSKLGLEEQLRVILGRVGSRVVAIPLAGGAGSLSTLVRADGLVRIPQDLSGLSEGEETQAELFLPPGALERKLLIIGSHDLTLDLIASLMKGRSDGRFLVSSSNVGSLGGLLALRRHIAHLAGSHLLDTQTGEYNRSYIESYLQDTPVTLITLVHRWQGFMVAPGNPKGIRGVKDLARPEVTFINRQAGSGTRILLDHELLKAGMKAESVMGYRSEEYTHMSIAMAVVSGRADAGLGISAAATAMGLDFIPLTRERYDLVIPTPHLDDERIKLLLEIIRSDEFRHEVEAMGGYEVKETGIVAGSWTGGGWA